MTSRGEAFLRMLTARGAAHVALEVRRGGNKHTRRLRRVRIRPQRQPDAIRRTYYEAISTFAGRAREAVRERVFSQGPALVAEAARLHGDALVLTLDSPAASTAKIFRDLARDFFGEFSNERVASVVRGYGKEISDFQRREVARQFEQAIGFDPFKLGEPWLQTRIEGFTAENVALIRTIPERYFADVETTLIRELRAGTRWEEISPKLEERFGVSDSNAERIARDQAGKFFGELNRARQQDVGVAEYTWRTAKDNRVRDAHYDLEGSRFRWDGAGAPGEGHPGEPILCRCQGEPDVSALLEALGEPGSTSVQVPEQVAPEAPAPEPESAPPAPVAPAPPTTVEAVHDRLREVARDHFGEDFTSTSVKLDGATNGNAAHRKWTGEIEIGPYTSDMLRDSLKQIAKGAELNSADVLPLKTVLHEEIHGLGKWKIPAKMNEQGQIAEWTDTMRAYFLPTGRMLEEGSTELMAQREIGPLLERLGVRLQKGAADSGYERFANGSYVARTSYGPEVHAVDTLCRLAVGQPLDDSALSAQAVAVLRKVSYEWAPAERISNLATMISETAPNATDAIADARYTLLRKFLDFQSATHPDRIDFYVGKIQAATNLDELEAVRKWLNLS